MEVLSFLIVIILPLTSATEVNETTTFSFETTEPVTEATVNDAIASVDPPLEYSDHHNFDSVESKEELAEIDTPIVVEFPINHKNFTPSQFLDNEIQLPHYNQLNQYQQQYKNYFEQKQLLNRKPIKFEENSSENFYAPQLLNGYIRENKYGYQVQEGKKQNAQRKPFPYVFEQDKAQDWYKNAGFGVVHEEQKELGWRGHQEVPHFIFPQGHSHEQKLYKTEPVTYVNQVMKKGKEAPWKKVFHLLTALVPLGLILASLTPNVISVNSSAVSKNPKQRSEDLYPIKFKEKDIIELMNKFGVKSLSEGQCEDRIICELARRGEASSSGSTEKQFWFLANETPWDVVEKAGMSDLFKAIKTGSCESYKCYAKSSAKNQSGKKALRKQKILEK